MAPQTVDFISAKDAARWRRSQFADLLAKLETGQQVALKVLGWGEIHGRLSEFDGAELTLISGRQVPLEHVLDVKQPPGAPVAVW